MRLVKVKPRLHRAEKFRHKSHIQDALPNIRSRRDPVAQRKSPSRHVRLPRPPARRDVRLRDVARRERCKFLGQKRVPKRCTKVVPESRKSRTQRWPRSEGRWLATIPRVPPLSGPTIRYLKVQVVGALALLGNSWMMPVSLATMDYVCIPHLFLLSPELMQVSTDNGMALWTKCNNQVNVNLLVPKSTACFSDFLREVFLYFCHMHMRYNMTIDFSPAGHCFLEENKLLRSALYQQRRARRTLAWTSFAMVFHYKVPSPPPPPTCARFGSLNIDLPRTQCSLA